MKKVTLLLLLIVACVGLTSLAGATTLQLIHASSQIGPYQMSLNGSYLEMVCGSLTKEITQGEIWYVQGMTYADIVNFVTAHGNLWGKTADNWNEAAYFALQLLAHPGNSQYQQDVWGAVDGGTLNPTDDAVYQSTIKGHWTFTGVWYFPLGTPANQSSSSWEIVGQTYTTGTIPQPFYQAPEPASLFLLGSGLFALALRRRRS